MNDTPPPDGLRDLLDSSFGDGPAHRPVDQVLAGGRRRLVRRRVTSGVAAVAVVGAMVTTFALAAGGSSPSAGIDPAASADPNTVDCESFLAYEGAYDSELDLDYDGDSGTASTGPVEVVPPVAPEATEPTEPTEPPAPTEGQQPTEEEHSYAAGPAEPGETDDLPDLPLLDGVPAECLEAFPEVLTSGGQSSGRTGSIAATDGRGEIGAPVEIDADGVVHHEDDVTVVRTADPLAWEAPDRSAAVEYRYDGRTYWALTSFVELGEDCGAWATSAAEPEPGTTLEAWAVEQGARLVEAGACADGPEPTTPASQPPSPPASPPATQPATQPASQPASQEPTP